jgi:hypothetical protein
MKMSWTVGPEAQRVDVEASLSGEERIWVNGTLVPTREHGSGRSEHVLPVSGHTVKLVLELHLGSLDYAATLFVDGVPLAPERVERPFSLTPVLVLMGLGAVVGVLLAAFYGLNLFVPLTVAVVSGLVLQRVASRAAQPLVPAVSVIWGHMAWVLLGIAFLGGRIDPSSWRFALTVLPLAAFLLLSSFLLLRHSRPLVLATGALVGVYFFLDLWLLVAGARPPELLLSQSMHVLLELTALLALGLGWRRLRQLESLPAAPPSADQAGPRPLRPMPWAFLGPLLVAAIFNIGRTHLWPQAPAETAPTGPTRMVTGHVRFVGDAGKRPPHMSPAALLELSVDGQRVPVAPDGSYSVQASRNELQLEAALRDTVERRISLQIPAEDAPGSVVPELTFTLTGGVFVSTSSRYVFLDSGHVSAEFEGTDFRGKSDNASREVYFQHVPARLHTLVVSAKQHETLRVPFTVTWGAFPTLKLKLDLKLNPSGCSPTVKSLGPAQRTLTGDSRFDPYDPSDSKGYWAVFSLQPCRAGRITDLMLFSEARNAEIHWESYDSRNLGVARDRVPAVLVNRNSSGSHPFEVKKGERLWLYSRRELPAGQAHVVRLRYEDGSYDQASLDVSR